jgi:hypothetical protein
MEPIYEGRRHASYGTSSVESSLSICCIYAPRQSFFVGVLDAKRLRVHIRLKIFNQNFDRQMML